MAIGMSVPGASDLGLGANLAEQTAAEVEEERKRKLRMAASSKMAGAPGASALGLGMAGGATAAGLSPGGY